MTNEPINDTHPRSADNGAEQTRPSSAGGVSPIAYDKAYDRYYIPLPGGWEVQTKGKGSTFRICDPQGERLAVPDSPYLHETLERMAREIHAACPANFDARLLKPFRATGPFGTFPDSTAAPHSTNGDHQ